MMELIEKSQKLTKHTQQIAGKQPPLIPISMIGIEITEDIEKKKIFVQKHFFKSDLF